MKAAERQTQHTKRLPPLVAGDHVHIQNQTCPHPTKWNKTGMVISLKYASMWCRSMALADSPLAIVSSYRNTSLCTPCHLDTSSMTIFGSLPGCHSNTPWPHGYSFRFLVILCASDTSHLCKDILNQCPCKMDGLLFRTDDICDAGAIALPTELYSHSVGSRPICWAHVFP